MPRGRTPKGEATRARIIAGAAEAVLALGVMDTTLDDVRERTGTSKGQIFHHFPGGKDELLTEVARHEADRVLNGVQARMSPLTTWEAWSRWKDQLIGEYDRSGADCPLRILVNHLGPATPGARAVVAELLSQWHTHIRTGLERMRSAGILSGDLDPAAAASAVLTAIQGGVVMLAATGTTAHLEASLDLTLAHLRTHALTPDRP
ncbi:TetR/AcrR family transcriptional regulator [Bailinhaonella thermotolerans]|uniref:TetR/AcrR family transcriptional regulator n=1 Tax=Bailinhaonella thermotolerans TaxID=1070861 RepID=A0A3A4ASY3_9ACTN|nr:TetR/AcrR family transcriptional regulator [Bailinhaonella thermotolerans]RJL22587.1 TetR/AcrR family transcriptional regulator [Bailinhaonella thermotolerans]